MKRGKQNPAKSKKGFADIPEKAVVWRLFEVDTD